MDDSQNKHEPEMTEEFRNLGKNIVGALLAAWEAPERKRLQQEIETGLNELGVTIRREAEYFASSPTGQQIKSEMQEISDRIRSGEAQDRTRQEILTILQTANKELQKVIQKWSDSTQSAATKTTKPEESEQSE